MQYEVSGYSDVGAATLGISGQRYKEIRNAKESCLSSVGFEEKLVLLISNYHEFEVELLSLGESLRVWKNRDHIAAMGERLKMDRRVVNLLTSCRLYLDQVDHAFSRCFGKKGEELLALKAYKRDLHSKNFGYRFMEALRNYVQHAELPVHNIGYHQGKIEGVPDDSVEFYVLPQTRMQSLVEDKSFKKSVIQELSDEEDLVDLRKHTRVYVDCLIKIHCKVRELFSDEFSRSRELYESAVEEYSVVDGIPVKFPHIIKLETNTGEFLEKVDLVMSPLDYYDSLAARNVFQRDLSASFTSNNFRRKP